MMTIDEVESLSWEIDEGLNGHDPESVTIENILKTHRKNVKRLLEERGLTLIDELLTFDVTVKDDDDYEMAIYQVAKVVGIATLTYPDDILSRLQLLAREPAKRGFVLEALQLYRTYLPGDNYRQGVFSLSTDIIDTVISLINPIVENVISLTEEDLRLLVSVLGGFPSPKSLQILHMLEQELPRDIRQKLIQKQPYEGAMVDVDLLQLSIETCVQYINGSGSHQYV